MRDLFEKNIFAPSFGAVDSRILGLVSQSLWTSAFDITDSKLAAKLSDLNRVKPGLGDLVLLTLNKSFDIIPVGETLPILPSDPTDNIPDSQRVQLAIRRYYNIYVSQPHLQKMTEEQRVALIIHEGLYSFLKLTCSDNRICEQSAKDIREIVGRLFLSNSENDLSLKDLLNQKLALPTAKEACNGAELTINLSLYSHDKEQSYPSPHSALIVAKITGRFFDDAMKIQLHQLCEKLDLSHNLSNQIIVQVDKSILRRTSQVYNSAFGTQTAIRFVPDQETRKVSWFDESESQCFYDIKSIVENWKSAVPAIHSDLYCNGSSVKI